MSAQCISLSSQCDGQRDCHSGTDEENCAVVSFNGYILNLTSPPPPAIVQLNPKSRPGETMFFEPISDVRTDSGESVCPESHFQCPGDGYCLPVYLRCNAVSDCPGREDEAGCSSYTCPGFYRCRGAVTCLHASHVCDGLYQCPQKDDEFFCDLPCPVNCTCHGLAFTCPRPFHADHAREARYLDVSHSGMTQYDLANNTRLVFLSMASCGLHHLNNLSWFVNLRTLDVSRNHIGDVTVRQVRQLPNLQVLLLAGNPLASVGVFSDATPSLVVRSLQVLDLSATHLREVTPTMLTAFPRLRSLNLSHSGVDHVLKGGLHAVKKLRVLDLRGCPLTQFPGDVFQGMEQLQAVYTDNYKVCCPATLPAGFNLNNCLAPFDEVSSCDALLRSDAYRVVLSAFSALALVGNVGGALVRAFVFTSSSKSGFAVMVTHLSVSDFLMGVYLAIVGVADRVYLGSYLWQDTAWRRSAACKAAGFLSLLSSEVSAFLVYLITLDRFLALRFPFSRLRFSRKSSSVACCLTWVGGGLLAAVPLLPSNHHWQFYSQTGICIPLPVTRNDFAGYSYAFGVMIVFNFVLFLLIASGQAVIFASIRANSMAATDTTGKSKELKVARRLITVAVTDFACWFPIATLGLLASRGVPIPGEVNVAMAIIVLPLNSALNPFLYNINMVLEKRKRAQEQKLLKVLMAENRA